MSEEGKEEKGGPSRRAVVGWGAGMLLALGVAWFVSAVAVPVWQTRAVVRACGDYSEEQAVVDLGGPEAAARRLSLYLRAPEWATTRRGRATRILGRCESSAVPTLIRLLRDRHENVRYEAAEGLGRLKDARAVPALIDALEDINLSVRTTAAWSLGETRDPRVVEPLTEFMNRERWPAAQEAAGALGETGDRRAIKPLVKALGHKDGQVALRAAEALGKFKDPSAVEGLVTALQGEEPSLRCQAATALQKVGKPALEQLRRVAQDRSVKGHARDLAEWCIEVIENATEDP